MKNLPEKGVSVLIIEDDASLRRVLTSVLLRHGYDVLEAADGPEGLRVFQERRPPVVVTDVQLPEMDGIEVLDRIKKTSPGTFVIISTGHGSESVAMEALRSGASNYLVKPFSIHEFSHAVGILADLSLHQPERDLNRRGLECEKRTFTIAGSMEGAIGLVGELTGTVACFSSDVDGVRVGLLEMITNAVEHGCLGISREEKVEALREGSLADLYRERAAAGRGRMVTVEAEVDRRRASFVIRDDGEGFDCSVLPDPESTGALTAGNGKGILLTRLFMDEVRYNEKGNEVTVVKLLDASGAPTGGPSSPTDPGGSGSTSPSQHS